MSEYVTRITTGEVKLLPSCVARAMRAKGQAEKKATQPEQARTNAHRAEMKQKHKDAAEAAAKAEKKAARAARKTDDQQT